MVFRALMGGSGSGRDDVSSRGTVRRKSSTKNGESSRRTSRISSSASSISSSRRPTRGDDRDRDCGLGDISASRSVTGDSTTTYVTAEPTSYVDDEPLIIERIPRSDRADDRQRSGRDNDRDARRKSEKNSTETRSRRDDATSRDRTQPRASSSGNGAAHFAAEIADPGFTQFPMQYDSSNIPGTAAPYHPPLDAHIAQQFPGQLPETTAQPYMPPNPAGLAADYYGDQGQSVAHQPGVRPQAPDIIIGAQPHLQAASPIPNPPPEPSSLGQVGAAAEYYAGGDSVPFSSAPATPKPPRPGKPSRPMSGSSFSADSASFGIGSELLNQASSHYPQTSATQSKPPLQATASTSSSYNGTGLALGGAAAGAAAAYMLNHHNDQSGPNLQYGNRPDLNSNSYGLGIGPSGNGHSSSFQGNINPSGPPGYSSRPPVGPSYSSSGMQPGSLAYHQKHHGPLSAFVNFWRDPEGVGKFEEYTEAIGVCKYCFEPGTTSRDAPRKHHYNRRRRSPVVDRYGSSSRVDKLTRYNSSEDESRRNKSKVTSWFAGGLTGVLAGYVAKSLFDNRNFEDSYSVRTSSRVESSRHRTYDQESLMSSSKASSTSRGVVSRKSSGHDKSSTYKDTKSYRYSRRSSQSRSRSTSRDRRSSSGLKEAAIGAAVGTALTAASMRSNQRNRSRERSTQHRTRRHSDSSGSENFERSRRRGRSSPQGFRSFFTAPSANRLKKSTKKERGFFSFGNSSSSSDDYDLAFGGHEKLGSTFSGRFSRSSKSVKSSRNSKVDAEILGLGLMARQLAHSSSRKELSPRDLVRPPNYGQASRVEDDEWDDAESSDSTVSANLAYGGSAVFGSQESVSSGLSFWPWRKSSRKKKKKKEEEEEEEAQRQYSEAPPMNDYSSQPAEYVSNDGSSGRGSLQRVYPVPTSDPSRFDYVRMSTTSSPNGEPQLIRPGPIPLQQPQPQPVVSQSVYYPTVAAAVDPLIQRDGLDSQVLTRSTQRSRRSNSSPVYPQMPIESEPSPGILKRRSTAKDPANVSIYLTEEQKERQKEVDRLDWERQRRRKEEEFALLRREADELAETERRRQAKEKRRAERRRLEEEEIAAQAARDARREQRRRETDVSEQSVVVSKVEATDVPRKAKRKDEGSKETTSSSSWVTPALVGAGAVAVAGVLAEKALEDDEHVTSRDRFDKRREERRSQRRRAAETQSGITEFSPQEPIREAVEVDDDQATRQQRIVKNAVSRIAQSPSTVHESYQDFFMPEDLRHDTDDNHDSSPNIIEIVPRSERAVQAYLGSDIDKPDPSWPPLVINIIKPTPPGSHEGSVRDSHSPAPTTNSTTQEVQVEEAEEPAPSRSSTGSRVSWGEHQFHEYEIETPLSEREGSVDERDHDERPVSPEYRDHENHYETSISRQMDTESYQPDSKHSMPGSFDNDVEFAATLAAGAEIAGFDPRVVTDDASYYTKGNKSPVAELKENYRSPAVETVTDLGETISTKPSVEKKDSRGPEISFDDEAYNKNEEASTKELSQVNEGNDFERRSVVAVAEAEYYDAPAAFEREEDKASRVETLPDESTTASEDRSKKSKKPKRSSKTLDDLVDTESEKNSRAIASSDIQPSKSQHPSTTSAGDDAEAEYTLKRIQSAPVTDDLIREEEKRHRRRSKHNSLDHSDSVDDETRSVAAASAPGIDELEEYRSRRSSRRSKHDDKADLDDDDDDNEDAETLSLHDGGDEEDGKRRRRRKHKRHSGNFDYVASVVSSPAKIDETLREKRRSLDSSVVASKELSKEREKKSGGLFSSIFGGSKANLDRSQSTSSKRETQSEVATSAATTDDSTSERRRKKKSSSFSSSRRSVSGDDVVVDDWDASNRAAEESSLDLSQLSKAFDNNENGDNDSQSSRRKRREQRRRDKYEEIIDSAREASEKDQSSTADVYDNDDKKSFLGTRPEMPLVDDDGHEEHSITEENMGGASGLGILPTALQSMSTPFQPSNLDDPLLRDVPQQQQQQRLRSRSVSPSMAEKTFKLTPRSQSRPSSPGGRAPSSSFSEEAQNDLRARRLSVLRNSDSPTAVPLHFRKPPTSPNSSHRRISMTFPAQSQSQSPVSPRPGGGGHHRRPNSVEFKNAREIRPLWLVERHSSSKLDAEPEGPLPSLPSSKTSSRSPSVENLREGWPEEEDAVTGFFMGGGSGGHGGSGESAYSWGRKPIDLRISTDRLPAEEEDFLNSQQATPTAETYISSSDSSSKQVVGPPSIKKEKPKYEFHSPSELLQDPIVYQTIVPEMPESIDRLPSVAGSDLSVKENEAAIQDPSNAEELGIARETEKDFISHQAKEKAPEKAQKGSSNIPSFLAGAGFGAIVDAAVSAAVRDHETNTRNVEQSEDVAKASSHEEARQEPFADDVTRDSASVSSTLKDHGGNFGDVVDAAVAAAVAGTSRDNTVQDHMTAVDEAAGQSRDSELMAEPVDAGIPAAAAVALDDAQADIDGTADAGSNSKKQKRKDKKKKKKGKDTGTSAEEVVEEDLFKTVSDAEIGSSSVQPEPRVAETARAEPSTKPANASSSSTVITITAQQEEVEEDESLRTQNESSQITNVSTSLESVQDGTRDIQPVDPDPDPLAAVELSLETGTTASTGNDTIAEINDHEDPVLKDANEEDSGATTASASKSSKKKKKNKRKSSIQSDPVSVGEGGETTSATIEEPQSIIDKEIESRILTQETSPPLSSETQIPPEPEVRAEEMQLGGSDQVDNNKAQEAVEDSQADERGADTAKEGDSPATNETAEAATSPQSPVDEWFDSTENAEEQAAEAQDVAEAFTASSNTNETEDLQEATAIAAAPIVAGDAVEQARATPSSSGQKKKKNKKKKGRSLSVDEAVTQDSTPDGQAPAKGNDDTTHHLESIESTAAVDATQVSEPSTPQTQEISQNLAFESEPASAETETKTAEDHSNEGERLPETNPQTREPSEMQPDLLTESAPVETPESKVNDHIAESSNELATTDSVSRTEEDLTSLGQQLPEETASTPSKRKKGKKSKRVSWAEPTEFKFESEPATPVDPESPAPEINASSEENAVKLQSEEEHMTAVAAVDTLSSTNPDLEPGLEKQVGETSPALTHQDQSVTEPENGSVPEPLPSAESTSDTQLESNADSQDVLSLPSGVNSSSHDSQQAVKDIDEESQPAESKKKSKKEKRKDKNKRKSVDSLPAVDDEPLLPTTAISTDEGVGPIDEDAIPEIKELEQPKTSEETPLPAITPEIEFENSEGLESIQAAAVERQVPEGMAVEAMQNPENEEISHTPLVESLAAGLEFTTSEAVETLESQASSHEVFDTGDTKSLVEPHMEKQDGEAVIAEPQTVAAVESSTPPPALISSDEVKSYAINSPSTEQLASEENQKEITVIDELSLPETPTEEAKPADPRQDDESNFQSSKAKKKKDKKKKKSEAAAAAAIASLTKEDAADPVAPIEVEENTGLAISDDSKNIEDPFEELTKFDELPSVVTLCETEHSKDSIHDPVNEAGDVSEALANQEKSPESVQKTEMDESPEQSSPQKDEHSLKEEATESILSAPLEQQTGKISTVEEAAPADANESQSSETPSQEAENIDAADNDEKLSKSSKSKKKKDKKKQKSRLSLTSDEISTPPAPEMVSEETEAKPVETEDSTPREPDLLTSDKTTAIDSHNENSSLVLQEAGNTVQEEQISEDRTDDNAFQETSTSKKKKGKKAKKAEKAAEARLLNENAATESDALRESGQNTPVLIEVEVEAATEPEVITPNDEQMECSDNRLEESRVGEILAEGAKTTETVQELSSKLPHSAEEEQCIIPSEGILAVDVQPQTPINDISTEPTATETSPAPVLPSEGEHNLNDTPKEQIADNTFVENSPEHTETAIAPPEDERIENNAFQSEENIDQGVEKVPESVPSLSQVDETPKPDEELSQLQAPIESFDNAETSNIEQLLEAETIDKDVLAPEAEQIENPDNEKSSLSSSKSKKKKDKKKNRKSLQSIADDAETMPSATADGMSDAVLDQTGETVAPLSQAGLTSEEMAKSSDTANEVQATDTTPQEIIQDQPAPEQSINIEDVDSTPKSGKSKKKKGKKNKARDETISGNEELPVFATKKPEEGLSAQDPVTEDLPSQEPILDVKTTDDAEPLSQQIVENNQASTQPIGDNERGVEKTESMSNEVEIPRDIKLTQEETTHAQELVFTPAKIDEDPNIDSLDATEEVKQQPDVNISSLSAFDQIQDERLVGSLAKETSSDDAGFVPATLGRKASKKKKRESMKALADSSEQQVIFTPSPTTEQERDLPSYDSSRQEEQVTQETATEKSLHENENDTSIEKSKSLDSSGADIGPASEESETKPNEPTRRLSAKKKRKEKKKRHTLEIGGGIDVSNEGQETPSEPTLVESPAPETNQPEEHDRFSSEGGEKNKENETFPAGGEEEVKETLIEDGTKLDGGRNLEDLTDYLEQQTDSGSKSNPDEQTDVNAWPGTTENEPQETPVEVEGKETFESSEETHIDQKEKDPDLTDNMVSPQVQSPFPVRSPTFDSHQDIDQSCSHASVDDLRSSNAVVSDSPVQPEAILQELAVDEEKEPKETSTSETALVDTEDQAPDWSTSKKSKKDKKKKKRKSTVTTPTENFIENENTMEPSIEEKDKLQNLDLGSVEVSQSKDIQEGFAAKEPSSLPEPSLQTDEITKDSFELVVAESENFRLPYKEYDNDGMLPESIEAPIIAKVENVEPEPPAPEEIQEADTEELKTSVAPITSADTSAEKSASDEIIPEILGEDDTAPIAKPLGRKLSKKEKRKLNKEKKAPSDYEERLAEDSEKQETARDAPEVTDTVAIENLMSAEIQEAKSATEAIATTKDSSDLNDADDSVPAAQDSIPRKLSKKEKRKNKKSMTSDLAEDDSADVDRTNISNEANLKGDNVDEPSRDLKEDEILSVSSEQPAEYPRVSLDPFDIPDDGPNDNIDQELNMPDAVKRQSDSEIDYEAILQARQLEKEADLAAASALFEEVALPKSKEIVSRQSSKKQKGKKNKKDKSTPALKEDNPDTVGTAAAQTEVIPQGDTTQKETDDMVFSESNAQLSHTATEPSLENTGERSAKEEEPGMDVSGAKIDLQANTTDQDRAFVADDYKTENTHRPTAVAISDIHEDGTKNAGQQQGSRAHSPNSQKEDVDMIISATMAAAGFSPSIITGSTEAIQSTKIQSQDKPSSFLNKVLDGRDVLGAQKGNSKTSLATTRTTEEKSHSKKINDIFPGLERVKYRKPSPKSQEKQIDSARIMEEPSLPIVPTPVKTPQVVKTLPSHSNREFAPTEVESTSKDRSSSLLFDSSPSIRLEPTPDTSSLWAASSPIHLQRSSGSLHRTQSIHGHHSGPHHNWQLEDELTPTKRASNQFPQSSINADKFERSPPRTPLDPIKEYDGHKLGTGENPYKLERPDSRNSRPLRKVNRSISGDLRAIAAASTASLPNEAEGERERERGRGGDRAIHEANRDGASAATQSDLHQKGKVTRQDKRGLSQPLAAPHTRREAAVEEEDNDDDDDHDHQLLEQIPSSSTYDPVTDKGKRPVRGMSDVYEGWGETPNSPRSPTRPPSIRRRQSMQHLQELETRLDQLISENRLLVAAKEEAEKKLSRVGVARRKSDQALNTSNADLRDKEAEIARLTSSLEWMQSEVQRLTDENEAVHAKHAELTASHAREVDGLRTRQLELASGMEGIVKEQISAALAEKDAELRRLRDELAAARQAVQELQQQIVAATAADVLSIHDEDYFDNACQRLCQHVQQWVLRFSKNSDLRRCRLLSEVRNTTVTDRFDNAILDGTDVDSILADRVRRRDVFVAVVMAMIWEYVFTRYLFGMDRDQRQKLKALEKQLSEVGPQRAVAHWRALTLTLLAKRPSFADQRVKDTEAVALEIMETLSQLLPPPQSAQSQLLESLRGVVRRAANLSIEMRTQRAEYVMLPPLQPEYDSQGDLARQVSFNAALMNERSGIYNSNEALEAQGTAVRLVLFPLVVKKGDDLGGGDEEIVVCPAQVLVAWPDNEKPRERDRMSTFGNRSVSSVVPSVDMGNMI